MGVVYVLVLGFSFLIYVYLVCIGGFVLYFVNFSVFGLMNEDFVRWDFVFWKDWIIIFLSKFIKLMV